MEHEALQDQKLEDELQSVTYKLVAHLICSENKCTNYRRSCYVQSKGAIHQVADSRAIRLWSRAIMRKEATLESPPVNVVLRPLDQTRRAKGNTSQESDSTTPSTSVPPIHIYNQPAPTPTPLSTAPSIPTFSSSGNQSDSATILQFVGPICAAAIQKNNA